MQVRAIAFSVLDGQIVDVPVWVVDFWRFTTIVGDEGLSYYLRSGYHSETVRVYLGLWDSEHAILRDFARLLRELTVSRSDLDTNGWLYDDLFMEYLRTLELRILQFNVEELCSAILEHLGL